MTTRPGRAARPASAIAAWEGLSVFINRRELLLGSAAGLVLFPPWQGVDRGAPRRRAVVVGINRYGAARGAGERQAWDDLEGAVNDARTLAAVLEARYGFAAADIIRLEDADATAARIRETFEAHLIDAANAGDLAVFCFAGHGSRVRNTASIEPDGYDDTLVPADAARGTPDIRDKELARLCRAAARKGIVLSVILDACHSGGMSRGIWNRDTMPRSVAPDPRVIDEPPDRDLAGTLEPDPSALGVLFLSAARRDQVAREGTFPQGPSGRGPMQRHGVFSKALTDVLATSGPDVPLERIFQRVDVLVRASGSLQEPQLAGEGRRGRGIFGQQADAMSRATFAVAAVNGGDIVFRGGIAAGLSRGCRLRPVGPGDARSERTAVEVVEASLAMAVANGSAGAVAVGDLFELVSWVTATGRALRVCVPQAPPADTVVTTMAQAIDEASRAGAFSLASLSLSGDATHIAAPTHVLSWQNGGWLVEAYPSSARQTIPSGDPARVLGAIPRESRLFVLLPPTGEMASALSFDGRQSNRGIEVVSSPAEADYLLAGAPGPGGLGYAWCVKDVFERAITDTPLPLYTSRTTTADELIEAAMRLAKIHGWLTLATPPGSADGFPYRLTFERPNGRPLDGVAVRGGDPLKLVLQADPADLVSLDSRGIVPRYVYVFSIAVNGEAVLLFPVEGNQGNLFPRGGAPQPRIELSGRREDFRIGPPFGHDSYFLVTSLEPLRVDDLEWSSVVDYTTRSAGMSSSDVGALLRAAGTGDRSRAWPVSTTWSVQRVSLVSAPRR